MKKLLFIILITLILGACNQTDRNAGESGANTTNPTTNTTSSAANATSPAANDMPKTMPDNFNFSIQYGIGKKNEIDTFEGTVTKDLITDGTATTEITFTESEMKKVYEKMREINIVELNKFTPEPENGTVCAKEPHGEDEWKVVINDETITHSLSLAHCEPTNDAKQMIKLRDYVVEIVESKDEFRELPASKGGYE